MKKDKDGKVAGGNGGVNGGYADGEKAAGGNSINSGNGGENGENGEKAANEKNADSDNAGGEKAVNAVNGINSVRKYSVRESVGYILRGYGVLRGLLPGFLPIAAARAVLNAALPFVNIVMSAAIINALASRRDPAYVLKLALFAASLNFVIQIAMQLMKRILTYLQTNIWWIHEKPLNEKQQTMDFARIEDPETRLARQKMHTYRQTNGNGILPLYWSFEGIICNFMTVVFSVGAFAPILSGVNRSGGIAGFVNSPWAAALFILLILGNSAFGMATTAKRAKKSYDIMSGFHFPNMIGQFLMENILGKYRIGKDLKVNEMRGCVREITAAVFDQMDVTVNKWAKTESLYRTYADVSASALSAFVYIFVAVKAALGSFGIGDIVQYVGGVTRFNAGFTGLAANIAELFANTEALRLYFDFLDMPDAIYHGSIPIEKRADNEYEIEFHDVGFKYPGSEAYALKGLNMKLRVGQRMAVVGVNGSGKTTMIKLLCRLYDPTEGEITLNGIDIRKYDYGEYMGIFGVVFQDFRLFSFALGQNVAASYEYDSAKATECLRKAGMGARLTTLPDGLETPLYKDFDENGVEISGGEAQKIAIARALYKDAPFIVLDEPTAALDPIAEFEIYSQFNEIVGDKTAVFISHRLSSCRFCHDIAVFHEGRLIQRGAHEELLADARGKYAELWNAQAQYYA